MKQRLPHREDHGPEPRGFRRWLYFHRMPELELFPADEDRNEAMRAALSNGSVGTIPAALLAFYVSTQRVFRTLVLPALGLPSWTASLMASVVALALTVVVVRSLLRRQTVRAIREELLIRGVRVCLACGYDLRHNEPRRCPECGRPESKMVPVRDGFPKPVVLSLPGWCIVVGIIVGMNLTCDWLGGSMTGTRAALTLLLGLGFVALVAIHRRVRPGQRRG